MFGLFKKKPKINDWDRKFCPECGGKLKRDEKPIKADPITGKILKTRVSLYCDECVDWDDVPIARHSWGWIEEEE